MLSEQCLQRLWQDLPPGITHVWRTESYRFFPRSQVVLGNEGKSDRGKYGAKLFWLQTVTSLSPAGETLPRDDGESIIYDPGRPY